LGSRKTAVGPFLGETGGDGAPEGCPDGPRVSDHYGKFCVSFEHDGMRYHVWIDEKTGTIKPLYGGKAVLYRNLPKDQNPPEKTVYSGQLFKNNAVGRGTHIPTRPMPPAVVECPAGALPFKMLYCLPKLGESNENSRGR